MLLLLLINLAVIILAWAQRWEIINLIWIYWWQNIIIGFFNFRRIMQLKHFSTKGLKIDGKQVGANETTKKSVAWFFSLPYILFHLVYLCIILPFSGKMTTITLFSTSVGIALFLLNHWYSYHRNLQKDKSANLSLATLVILPYARVIPMHLIVFLGALFGPKHEATLISFLLLKTGADICMNHIERAVWEKSKKS